MFYDLGVAYPALEADLEGFKRTVELLRQFGYKGIAYNHVVVGKAATTKPNPIKFLFANPDSTTKSSKQSTGGSKIDKRTATNLLLSQGKLPFAAGKDEFTELSRLTVVVEEMSHNYGLTTNNAIVASYDLVAVQPTTEKMFQAACATFEIDIITLDLSMRLPFHLKHTTINQAIQRGIYFEISYGAALRDTNARRNLIGNVASLIRATRGRNMIITSDAKKAMEVRGPHDVMNL
ncbi:hypothetical protein HK102_002733 [Quaeritorhiza haematococci]|nr:hypothetical protein HK102_002733 [Quaeritorhiza haematococci]